MMPLAPYLPLLSFAASVYLMINLPVLTWYRFLAWLVVGLIIYFTYSIKHSRIACNASLTISSQVIPQPAFKHEPKPPQKN